MKVALPIVRPDRYRLHESGAEGWIGVPTPGTGLSRHGQAIEAVLRTRDAPFGAARAHWDEGMRAADDAALIDHRRSDAEISLGPFEGPVPGAGRSLGATTRPTVSVEEGGHDLTTIGALVAETLAARQEGATRA